VEQEVIQELRRRGADQKMTNAVIEHRKKYLEQIMSEWHTDELKYSWWSRLRAWFWMRRYHQIPAKPVVISYADLSDYNEEQNRSSEVN